MLAVTKLTARRPPTASCLVGTPGMHGQGAVNAATNEAEKGGRHGNRRVPSCIIQKKLLLVSSTYLKRSLGFSYDHYSLDSTTLTGSVTYSKLELQQYRE
jgi:hypothetical protein